MELNELRDYDLANNLSNQSDEDLMDGFGDYSVSTYICDAIAEIADSNVGIYTKDILDHAGDLYFDGAYEEASFNGLMEGSNDLIKNLQSAWYEYNQTQLYSNLEALIFNYAMHHLNALGIVFDDVQREALEEKLAAIDHNNRIGDITDAVAEILEEEQEMKAEQNNQNDSEEDMEEER